METYIVITKTQKVKVPITPDFTINDFITKINNHELFDEDNIDWDKEEIIDEDYSYALYESEVCTKDKIYTFQGPYKIGTLYKNIDLSSFSIKSKFTF